MVFFYSFLALFLSQAVAQGGPPGGNFGGHGPPGAGPGGGPIGSGAITHGFGGKPGNTGPPSQWAGEGQTAGSPNYTEIFQNPLPLPALAVPEYSTTTSDGRTIDFYSIEIKSFEQQVYPNLGPAKLTGYNGVCPGPTFVVERYHETIIRYLNSGSGPSVVHLHGSYTHAPWDGWADDEIQPGEYKDYYYPNSEPARSIWYHDHTEGHTADNAYYGQAGVYQIHDPAEDSLGLPSGDYDIPLAIADKKYQSDGDLAPPTGDTNSFFGDIIHVNEQPWPYLAVEPRKYRFRIYDMSLSRPYDLYFQDPDGNLISFQVIASDSGLFGSPVTTSDVVIAMGERYEVVVDFSQYAGKNITLKNGLEVPQISEFADTDKVMLFKVGDTVSDSSNNGDVPGTLNPSIMWPGARDTVDHVFNFQQGGEAEWTINGVDFNDVNNRILAKPPQGTVERWQVVHASGPAVHPVHIHLVNMQVVSRTGGSRGVLPYEAAGLKDVVMLEPGETVDLLAYYGPWDGVYMFHCHNLIHEDNTMMAAFNVTVLEGLGYDFNTTIGFADPMDPRFAPKENSANAFDSAAISSAVASLASLNPYQAASSLMAAESAYYASAGYNGDNGGGSVATPTPSSGGKVADYVMQGIGGTQSAGSTASTTTPAATPAPTGPGRRRRRSL